MTPYEQRDRDARLGSAHVRAWSLGPLTKEQKARVAALLSAAPKRTEASR